MPGWLAAVSTHNKALERTRMPSRAAASCYSSSHKRNLQNLWVDEPAVAADLCSVPATVESQLQAWQSLCRIVISGTISKQVDEIDITLTYANLGLQILTHLCTLSSVQSSYWCGNQQTSIALVAQVTKQLLVQAREACVARALQLFAVVVRASEQLLDLAKAPVLSHTPEPVLEGAAAKAAACRLHENYTKTKYVHLLSSMSGKPKTGKQHRNKPSYKKAAISLNFSMIYKIRPASNKGHFVLSALLVATVLVRGRKPPPTLENDNKLHKLSCLSILHIMKLWLPLHIVLIMHHYTNYAHCTSRLYQLCRSWDLRILHILCILWKCCWLYNIHIMLLMRAMQIMSIMNITQITPIMCIMQISNIMRIM